MNKNIEATEKKWKKMNQRIKPNMKLYVVVVVVVAPLPQFASAFSCIKMVWYGAGWCMCLIEVKNNNNFIFHKQTVFVRL